MSALSKPLAPVVYPETDDMGEHELQRFITELLRPMIEAYLRERGIVAHAGADTFFYYVEGDPGCRFAPDLYVLEGVPQDLAVASWKLWEGTPAPRFALEIVSRDVAKDYARTPEIFGQVGGEELVLFDPEPPSSSRRRALWTVFRRGAEGFRMVEQSNGDRVYSEVLGCFLRVVGEGARTRLRLALPPDGDELVPTEAEARLRVEARAAADRLALKAENQRLLAELAALRRRS